MATPPECEIIREICRERWGGTETALCAERAQTACDNKSRLPPADLQLVAVLILETIDSLGRYRLETGKQATRDCVDLRLGCGNLGAPWPRRLELGPRASIEEGKACN